MKQIKMQCLIGLALVMASVSSQAQTLVTNIITVTNVVTVSTNPTAPPRVAIAPAAALSTLWDNLKVATNYAVAPYMTYAPKAPQKVGGGVLVVYNVSQYFGAGLGADYLGNFELVSGNIQLKLPTHPLANYGFPNIELTPFTILGIGTPIAGGGNSNGGIATIADIGAYMKFGHWLGGEFGIGGTYGKWTGSGPYDVDRYHAFVSWQRGF